MAEIPEIPDVLTYGATVGETMVKVGTLALRILAERIKVGENRSMSATIELVAT